MRLLKFHGRTMQGTLDQVRNRLGDDALIIETREVKPGSAVERLRPGARFEVTAAVDESAPARRMKFGEYVKQRAAMPDGAALVEMPEFALEREIASAIGANESSAAPSCAPFNKSDGAAPFHCGAAALGCASDRISIAPASVLSELAELKSQLRDLLAQSAGIEADIRDQRDLVDYRHLVKQGVDLSILAPSFRRWLEWKTAPKNSAHVAPGTFESAFAMTGGGFREWLWLEWTTRLSSFAVDPVSSAAASSGPEVVGVLGRHGVGKSTTLAKMASKIRLQGQKKVAIISMDSSRPGASEQWRRLAPIMDVAFLEHSNLVNSDSYTSVLENFDWVGIDTPGGLMPGSPAMADYGALLARSPRSKTFVVLDSLARDPMNREEISRMRTVGASDLIFTKLDQTAERGALVNLTFEGPLAISSAGTGTRAPEDLEAASPEALWRWVFASADCPENGASPRP